jgi:hypothetical protein
MILSNLIACICEGAAEEALIELLKVRILLGPSNLDEKQRKKFDNKSINTYNI